MLQAALTNGTAYEDHVKHVRTVGTQFRLTILLQLEWLLVW